MEELTADGYEILRQKTPFGPLNKLFFPEEASKSGFFLGGVLGRPSMAALLTLSPKTAALEAFLLLSRGNRAFSARVGPVPIHLRRLASAERYTPGPIPLAIQALPVFQVAVGVVRLLEDQFFNELLTLSGLPRLFQERLGSLKRDLPVPPPGPSPGQTAPSSHTSKPWSLLSWTTPRRPRASGKLPGT